MSGKSTSIDVTVQVTGLSCEERKALFDRNQRLAEWAAKRYSNQAVFHPASPLPADDLRQAARIGLWRACMAWDPAMSSKLSTFAVRCMMNEMHRVYRRESPRPYVHLDVVADVLPDLSPSPEAEAVQRDGGNVVEIREAARRILRKAKRNGAEWTAADVAEMLSRGMTQSEIAAKLGVTRQRIGQVVEMIRRELYRAESEG